MLIKRKEGKISYGLRTQMEIIGIKGKSLRKYFFYKKTLYNIKNKSYHLDIDIL